MGFVRVLLVFLLVLLGVLIRFLLGFLGFRFLLGFLGFSLVVLGFSWLSWSLRWFFLEFGFLGV